MNGKSSRKALLIDGKTDLNEICSIFDEKYRKILDDPNCQDGQVRQVVMGRQCNSGFLLSLENINNAIYEFNIGTGWDRIHANHFKFSGPIFRNLLTKLFSGFLEHSHIPLMMLNGEIRPVVKCNALSKNDSNNYRPVMNSAMTLKILEYSLLPSMLKIIKLSEKQFGFRNNTGCLSAIALVKETIFKYHTENSNVHSAMVDCSKAFDRINKNILFDKLVCTDLDPKIVNIIRCMYSNAYVSTLFNGVKTESWKIGNGVRQGGILSPLLFSFYINEVLETISNMPVGCSLPGFKTCVLAYADDLIFLAPSGTGLQSMLDSLDELLSNLCLTINPQKSSYMLFKHRGNKTGGTPDVRLSGITLNRVSNCKYLGVILTENKSLGNDVDRVTNAFLKQFNAMYGKFHFSHKNVLYYLFKSYTSSFYGIETWFEQIKCYELNKIGVSYHKAVKRLSGLNMWDSNHVACEIVQVPIFKHLMAKRLICFWHNLCNSKSPCLITLKYYFRFKAQLFYKISDLFARDYDVDISLNPLCAILARIRFVERNEPRSHYVGAQD